MDRRVPFEIKLLCAILCSNKVRIVILLLSEFSENMSPVFLGQGLS